MYLDVPLGRHGHDVPFDASIEVAEVDADGYFVTGVQLLVQMNQVDLKSIIGPANKSGNLSFSKLTAKKLASSDETYLPNFIVQCCSSNGKNSTLIVQELL